MRLRNTSGIPTDAVREALAFVRPNGIGVCDVRVCKSQRAYRGRWAYCQGSGYHATAYPFIVLAVGDTLPVSHKPQYPRTWKPRFGGKRQYLANRIEALVWIAAHEYRHIWQGTHKRGRVWGSKGKQSERDSDAYALRMLRAWRRR